jgi:hypothetical protein
MVGISSRGGLRGGLLTNPYYPVTRVGRVAKKSLKKRRRRVLNPTRSILCCMHLKALPVLGLQPALDGLQQSRALCLVFK